MDVWKSGNTRNENARKRERERMMEWDGARSLIPPVVRGAALLMCWGSHIVAKILSMSRHVLCVCVCACAGVRVSHTSLLWSHKSHRSATCQHLHITGSSVSDNSVYVGLTTWEGFSHTHKHTHTSIQICGMTWLCLRWVLCYSEDSLGSQIHSKFLLSAWP